MVVVDGVQLLECIVFPKNRLPLLLSAQEPSDAELAASCGGKTDVPNFRPGSSLFEVLPSMSWLLPKIRGIMIALWPPAAKEVSAYEFEPFFSPPCCPELPPYVVPRTPCMLESMKPDSSDAKNGRMHGIQAVIIDRH